MSLICIICQEPITTNPVPGKEADWDGHQGATVPGILVTKCGHAYHEFCLTKWFESSGTQDCPFCKTYIRVTENRKIFAIGDEDFKETTEAQSEGKFREQELATLRHENGQVHDFLRQCHESLEAEEKAHDALKFQYACQESNFVTLKTEAEEKIAQLEDENTKLKYQIETLKKEATKPNNVPEIKKALEYVGKAQVSLCHCLNEDDNDNDTPQNVTVMNGYDDAGMADFGLFEFSSFGWVERNGTESPRHIPAPREECSRRIAPVLHLD